MKEKGKLLFCFLVDWQSSDYLLNYEILKTATKVFEVNPLKKNITYNKAQIRPINLMSIFNKYCDFFFFHLQLNISGL